MKTKLTQVCIIAALAVSVSMNALSDEVAAGPAGATNDVACTAASQAPGSIVTPLNRCWEYRWGKHGGWKRVSLPHDAQFEQPWSESARGARGFKPMGEAFYKKSFAYDPRWDGRRVFLDFGGIMAIGDVYLNGKKVASTEYGYLGFEVEVTDALNKDGRDNQLEVWASTGPKESSRWYTGCGLYRGVKIVAKPQTCVARHGLYVVAKDNAVDISVELDGFQGRGRDSKLDVIAFIKDADGVEVADAAAIAPYSKQAHQEVKISDVAVHNAKLWDVDSPYLYTCEVSLVCDGEEIDRVSTRFGFRTVELDAEYGLKLNGRKVFVKSMSNHCDMGLVGVAAYRRAIERQFKKMKEFGYNAVRCSHNPYSEDFYELADEMGLLVMDELIDKWSDKSYWAGRRPFTQIWPSLVTEWIKRDRNHPSVFCWSFGNEFQMREDLCGYPELGDWGVTMYRIFKTFAARWDSTRPTTACMYPACAGAITFKDKSYRDDPHAPEIAVAADFAALNYQWELYPDFVRNAPGLNIFQSEATVNTLQQPYLGMDQEHSIGCSYWGAIAYWGESNKWPKKGWNFSFFSHSLEPNPSAYLIKSVMSDEPVVRIAVKDGEGEHLEWNDVNVGVGSESSAWQGKDGEVKHVRVYTNQKEVELFLNGKSLGKKANDGKELKDRNVVEFDVPFAPGELKAVAGKVEHAVRTAGEPASLDVVVENDGVANGSDLIYVRCYALDANGVRVPFATNRVEFACEGAAKFLACDNDDQYTDYLFTPDITAKNMHRGFMLAAFRTGCKPGEARISIRSEGMQGRSLFVPVK